MIYCSIDGEKTLEGEGLRTEKATGDLAVFGAGDSGFGCATALFLAPAFVRFHKVERVESRGVVGG